VATVESDKPEEVVDTTNFFAVHAGSNMEQSTWAQKGLGKWVSIGANIPVVCRTKQAAYRLAAWLVVLAEANDLPDEEVASDLDAVIAAVENV
jgi:hypothetical protein